MPFVSVVAFVVSSEAAGGGVAGESDLQGGVVRKDIAVHRRSRLAPGLYTLAEIVDEAGEQKRP